MFKYIAFMRRRPDLDLDAFRRLYEEEHAPFALSLLKGVRRYVRNYPVDDTARLARDARQRWEPDFDVMTEMWFDDEAAYREAFRDRDAVAAIRRDEERMYDLESMRFVVIDERVTDDLPS